MVESLFLLKVNLILNHYWIDWAFIIRIAFLVYFVLIRDKVMIIFLTTLLDSSFLVVVLLILIQRTSGGMGSALGGLADQVLGAGSATQLTKLTVWGILGFLFWLSCYMSLIKDRLEKWKLCKQVWK